MNMDNNDPRIERMIEEFAIQMEIFGLPKLGGRLFSALLFADPPEKSTQELIRLTGGSKGAISQMMRLLSQFGPIEKCASPNIRGHHYRLRRHFLVDMLEQKMNAIRGFHKFLKSKEEEFTFLPEQARENIQEMIEFQIFFERIVLEAFDNWKEQKSKRSASGSMNIVTQEKE